MHPHKAQCAFKTYQESSPFIAAFALSIFIISVSFFYFISSFFASFAFRQFGMSFHRTSFVRCVSVCMSVEPKPFGLCFVHNNRSRSASQQVDFKLENAVFDTHYTLYGNKMSRPSARRALTVHVHRTPNTFNEK